MFNQAKFKRVFKESGLTKSELASLYGVSRQTVYSWYKGDATPTQKTLAAREEMYSRALVAAIERGVLPLRDKNGTTARANKIQSMVQTLYVAAAPK